MHLLKVLYSFIIIEYILIFVNITTAPIARVSVFIMKFSYNNMEFEP